MHRAAVPRLAGASEAHVLAYLKGLMSVEGFSNEYDPYWQADLCLPIVRDRIFTNPEPRYQMLTERKLLWLTSLGDREAVKTCKEETPPKVWNQVDEDVRTKAMEFLQQSDADRDVPAKIKAGEEVSQDELLDFARRTLGQLNIEYFLRAPNHRSVFFTMPSSKMVWFDGKRFVETPMIHDRMKETYDWIHAGKSLDERLLYFSGAFSWSLFQRYGNVVLVQESTYYSGRGEAWPTLDANLDCKEEVWTDRIREAFVESRSKSQKRVNDYQDEKKGFVFVRTYYNQRDRSRSGNQSFWETFMSRGVQGDALISGGSSPGVLRLNMLESEDKQVTLVEQCADAKEAAAAFEENELRKLADGWALQRIISLPIREIDVPFRLQVQDQKTRETIDKLRAMVNSDDPAQHKQAESLVLDLDNPIIDAWVLDWFSLHNGAGFSRSKEYRHNSFGLPRISGTPEFDAGRLGCLLKRADAENETVMELRGLHALSCASERLYGYWQTPLYLGELDAFPKLEVLILDSDQDEARTSLSGLEHAAKLESLEVLVIRNAEGVDLSPLANAPALRHLQLFNSSAHGLATLRDLPLETLCVTDSTIDGLDAVPRSLRWLELIGPGLSFKTPLAEIPDLDRLTLHVEECKLQDVGGSKLRIVDLRGPWVHDLSAFEALAKAGTLKGLGLHYTPITLQMLPKSLENLVSFAEKSDLLAKAGWVRGGLAMLQQGES